MRLRIAGVEVEVTSNREDLLAAMVRPWVGYVSGGGEPEVRLAYEAVEGFVDELPETREYPGFGVRRAAGDTTELGRRDMAGVITLTPGGAEARFTGIAAAYCIETALRLIFAQLLPARGGLMLHASGVRTRGQALLFPGVSGAGKTTVSRLLARAAPDLALLGDDLTVVDATFRAHATPFAGEAGPAPDGSAPLAGLYFLRQGSRHAVHPLAKHEAMLRLVRTTMTYATSASLSRHILAAAETLVTRVPCHVLEFLKDEAVAHVLPVT